MPNGPYPYETPPPVTAVPIGLRSQPDPVIRWNPEAGSQKEYYCPPDLLDNRCPTLRVLVTDGHQETELFQTRNPEQIQQARAWVESLIWHLHGFEPKKGAAGQPWRVWTADAPAGRNVSSIGELTRVIGCTREAITSALTRRRNAPFLPPDGLAVPPGIIGYTVKGSFFCRLEDWVRHVQNPPQ